VGSSASTRRAQPGNGFTEDLQQIRLPHILRQRRLNSEGFLGPGMNEGEGRCVQSNPRKSEG